jgi:GNAT superfamily N-acetyltransferase
MVTIRTATPSDAAEIAAVHVESWKTTYSGIVADIFLDALSIETRTDFWSRTLSAKCDNVFVAVNGKVVGFCSAAKARNDNGYDAEIYSLYVLKEFQHQKIGSQLFNWAVEYLQHLGYSSMYIWVLEKNPSKNFYERMGGKQFAQEQIKIGNESHVEVAYGWVF